MEDRAPVIPSCRVIPHGHYGWVHLSAPILTRVISAVLYKILVVVNVPAKVGSKRSDILSDVLAAMFNLFGLELRFGIIALSNPIRRRISLLNRDHIQIGSELFLGLFTPIPKNPLGIRDHGRPIHR